MRADDLNNMIKTGEQIVNEQKVDYRNAEEIWKQKGTIPHTPLSDIEKCPMGASYGHCIVCECTDIIGYCCYPVDIQKEIEECRARPFMHDHSWPALESDYKRREDNWAFAKVNKR